jgi:hypothetical protein
MTSKTNTTKKVRKSPAKAKSNTVILEAATVNDTQFALTSNQTDTDLKNAILIVSLLVNAFILIAWITLKVTSQFDYQIANFLFYR